MSEGEKKTKKPLHPGIGHFRVGTRDGVNAGMMRSVEGLLEIQPEIKITLRHQGRNFLGSDSFSGR